MSVVNGFLQGAGIPASEKGAANGVASLDANGKVPAVQVPPLPYLPLTGGTMTGTLNASNPAVGTQAVRNIYAGTADLTAGSSALATGLIYFVYE